MFEVIWEKRKAIAAKKIVNSLLGVAVPVQRLRCENTMERCLSARLEAELQRMRMRLADAGLNTGVAVESKRSMMILDSRQPNTTTHVANISDGPMWRTSGGAEPVGHDNASDSITTPVVS